MVTFKLPADLLRWHFPLVLLVPAVGLVISSLRLAPVQVLPLLDTPVAERSLNRGEVVGLFVSIFIPKALLGIGGHVDIVGGGVAARVVIGVMRRVWFCTNGGSVAGRARVGEVVGQAIRGSPGRSRLRRPCKLGQRARHIQDTIQRPLATKFCLKAARPRGSGGTLYRSRRFAFARSGSASPAA